MRKKILIIVVILVVSLSVCFAVYSFNQEVGRDTLPALGQIGNFSLMDENGEAFGLADLAGRVWIGSFFFTTCGDICPVMTRNLAALNRSYALVKSMRLVSISVNPEYDSPGVLRNFAEKYNADTANWHFLTGPRDEITRLAVDSFKLGKIDEPVFHSSYLTLVDRNGLIRGYYEGTNQDAINQLFKDAAKLLKER